MDKAVIATINEKISEVNMLEPNARVAMTKPNSETGTKFNPISDPILIPYPENKEIKNITIGFTKKIIRIIRTINKGFIDTKEKFKLAPIETKNIVKKKSLRALIFEKTAVL